MRCAKTLLATIAVTALASPAFASWQWVDDGDPRTYGQPSQPAVVQQVDSSPVVTHREKFYRNGCNVTRTFWSDGTSSDERSCWRPPFPHEIIRDHILGIRY